MNALPDPAPPAGRGLRWSGRSDRGKVRKNNEDSFLGLQFDAQEAHLLGKVGAASLGHADHVFAVSDGIGGAHAGEYASRIAVERITLLLPRSYRQSALGLEAGFGDVLSELFDQVHRSLLFVGGSYEECEGMGATLTLCWFTPTRMFFGHIGDSRLYYLPAADPRCLTQISHDDTHVGWLHREGKINEREARTHPRRNLLQRALGAGHQFVEPQVGTVSLAPGDLFLLCSDGVVDGLFNQQILETLRPAGAPADLENAAHVLVDAALERSGRDNTTAIVVEVV